MAQWAQIESLFHAAVKLASTERATFLAEACAGDVTLRREVEALLVADDSSESATAILSPQVIVDGLAQAKAERFTGTRINQYQILLPLGAGGMGEVFLAEDARLQRKVALKLLPANYTNDRERVRRFEQEARAASALNHPNIITIHDLGESDSGCFIVMEHVAGRTLRALAAEPIALPVLLDWSSQVAKALHAAHAANIIHRDIKPDNIMVREDGYVKVLDFGLARLNTAHDELSSAMTMPGTVMGTVKYMSPEQTRGEVVTAASDIFAFGIVLYELATGQHPFIGATMFAVMQAITAIMPVALSQLNPVLPAELNALVLQMLAKDAAARPSAKDIAAMLDTLARGSGTTKPTTNHQPPAALRHTVGRATERAELQAAFRSGRSSLLCIAGEPGIGKTTLVEDWLSELAATHSCTIARGRCSERLAGTEAYLPLLEALESLLQLNDATAAQMRQLAPTWYTQVASISNDDSETQKLLVEVKAASQERMKRELAAFLTTVAEAQSLVIFFDDLHWADVSTIDLLNFLASKFDAMRVLIVVTYRPSDMLLAKHPFLQIKPDLQARGLCRELLLEFLTEAEIAEYLTLEFPGHHFPPEFPQLIHAKTEGSPLFMADLVRYLRDRSVIANTSGVWKLEQTLPDIERELPESVRGMIERKIAQLSEEDRKLLTCASVQGYEFDSAVVAQVLHLEADEVEERLETLERVFAFVKLTSESEFPNHELTLKYRFVHVLYQNLLYEGLRTRQKVSLSRDTAHALESFYGKQTKQVANELATLYETAREFAHAADYFLLAAEHSSQVFAVQEAEQLARRGLAMIEKLSNDATRQTKELPLQILLANALIATQGYSASEVEQAYLRGHELCQLLGAAADPLPILGGLGLFRSMRGQFQAGREMAEEFLEIARRKHDPAELFGQQMIAFSTYYLGDLIGAIKLYKECAAAYEPDLHRSLAWVYGDDVGTSNQAMLSMLQWQAGYPEQAFHHLEESLRLAQEVSQANSQAYSLYFKAYQYLLRREPDEALRGADQTIALCTEHGLPFWIASAKLVRGWALVQQGQPDEGIEELCEGSAIYQGIGTELALTILFCMVADAYLKARKPEEGLQAVAQGLAVVEKNNERIFAAELWRLKGELWLQADGDHHEAESCFQQAIEIAQQQSAKSWELRAATSLARLWWQQGKIDEARQMLSDIYGWFTEGFDTADLQDAKALLGELSTAPTMPPANTRHTVGREKERAELHSGFASALGGRGQLLCVAGEPGIGKTTLVEDFLVELAAGNQCTIARGRCSERLAGTEAYLPLLEALESLFQRNHNPALAQRMRHIAPTWYAQIVPLSGESEESVRLLAEVKAASQERMKRELAAFLQEVARLHPLVLFFDDLHWADVSTIDLLSFLAGKFDALNVLIVVTYRPSDMLLAKHPFLQIKPDLQARGMCRELLLEFLTEAEIAEYLALEFPGHRFPPEFPKLIHAKTEGSPLFMADLVRYLRDRSVIASASGVWTLAQTLPDIERELPESVRGMIERKIAQLSEEDRKLLTCASVQGYVFDSAVVTQVLNLEADEIEERLEKLERVFAFVKLASEAEFPNGALTLKYRFVHVLYQNALYASLRVTRRATLSRDVALALEVCYGARSSSVANELALLWEAARDYARASDSFLQAASNAAQFNAHGEAVQLAERGLAVLLKSPETQERDKRELGLQLTRGISLMSVMGWTAPEAGTAFHRARQLCQQWGDDSRLFAVLNGTAHHHQVRAEYEIARELYEQMRQIAEQSQNPALMVVAATRLALSYCWTGKDFNLGRQLFEQAIALNRQEYHPSYLLVSNDSQGVTAHRVGCYFLWVLGYSDQAMAMAQKGVTLAERLSHPFSLGGAYAGTGVTHFLLRDWQASQQEIEKIFALAEQYDLGDILKWAIAFNALNLAFQEPTEAAFTRAKQAIASLRAKGVMLGMTWCLSGLAEACWQANRSEEGLAIIAEAQTLAERTGERSYEADIWRVKGELLLQAAADDAQTEAESCYQKAFAIAQQQSAKIFELRAATSLARLWQQQGKTAEARQMLAEIYGWFTEGFDTADLQDAKALLEELHQQITTTSDNRRHEFNLQVVASEADTLKRELMTPVATAHQKNDTPSIAVLPFVNISNDPDNEYFCDGLAEELLNALSKIEALHVAARTSSFSFKGKETDIREIGQKLSVGTVLEGSVRKAGNRLRITAQLINIADGYHLWSERYDRLMEDIFDIQDEISLAIVDALKVKLLGAEKAAVTKRYTDNFEAYELYLKGRFHYGKWTEEGLKKSIEFFNQAISKEPNHAPAYAGVANAHVALWFYGFTVPEESVPIIKSASVKAVAIDGDLAESHFAHTRMKVFHEWDWSAAERGFKRTLALNPNYAEAHEQYALLLAALGRAHEAISLGRRALELNPLSLVTNLNVGYTYWVVGRYDLLREQGEKLIEFSPDFHGGYWLIAAEQWGTGKYEQAISTYQTSVSLSAGPLALAYLGYLYGFIGKQDEAQKVLTELQELSVLRHLLPFEMAMVNVGLGELDRAFALFEQAYEQRAGILIYLKYISAMMPGFKDEPRLADLLRRIGLPT